MTTYRGAGVDLKNYDRAIDRIVALCDRTLGPAVLPNPGGFAGLYSIGGGKVLVGCTDGAGTKVKLASLARRHDTIGIDLVAMSVNDLVVTGARPLFFLDYVAVGRLQRGVLETIVSGIVDGCRQAGCALLGGETAEMPGLYAPGDFDLAGFAVGMVERTRILGARHVRAGDAVVALASSGLHSNGFSLVRAAFGRRQLRRRAEELLTPTAIYVRPILELLKRHAPGRVVRCLAHITGGGIAANTERVIPSHLDVELSPWEVPSVFEAVRRAGRVSLPEMYRVFNMGIGMTLICAPDAAAPVVRSLGASGVRAWRAGRVVPGRGRVRILPD
jgi:phosphoribosylformylglycinamidine cyclo-ligase